MVGRDIPTVVESIFLDAIDLPEQERARFLDETCKGDAELRQDVEALLHHTDHGEAVSTSFLLRAAGLALLATSTETLPIALGRYELLSRIGEGSCGVVYRSAQRVPVRREVAVKVVRPGIESPEVLRRFDAERQALAALDHPNIARLYDAGGMPDGRPFFVMELLDGLPITEYCDRHRLGLRDRLELFLQVCAGVEHAHRRAILHRDLKPTNLLVQRGEGGAAQAKVIDFGVARALGADRLSVASAPAFATETGRVIGTPEYMSPEQVLGDVTRIDTRSDVYALGVVLYELLCGRLPFASDDLRASPARMRRLICDTEPPPPSAAWPAADRCGLNAAAGARGTSPDDLRVTLRRELEWVPLKALRKDPSDRYDGVAELAADVRGYLDGLPLQAARQTRRYRARKFAARYRAPLAVATAAALFLLVSLVVSLSLLARARAAQASAAANARTANLNAAMLRVQQGNVLLSLGRYVQAASQFDTAEAELSGLSGPSWIAELGLWDLARHAAPPTLEWDLAGGGRLTEPQLLPDGRHAVVGSTAAAAAAGATVMLVDVRSGAVEQRHALPGSRLQSVRLTADGSRAFLGDEAGGRLFEWFIGPRPPRLVGDGLGKLLAVDPNGTKSLHMDPGGHGVVLFHAAGAAERPERRRQLFLRSGPPVCAGLFLPGGKILACGNLGFKTCLWNESDPDEPACVIDTGDWCTAMAASPDRREVVVADGNRLHVCDLTTGSVRRTFTGHTELVVGVTWPADDPTHVYSCSWDGTCRAWDVTESPPPQPAGDRGDSVAAPATNTPSPTPRVYCGAGQPISGLSVSANGRRIVAATWDGRLLVWPTAPPPAAVRWTHDEPTRWQVLGAMVCDDDVVAIGEGQTPVVLYDRRTGVRLGDLGKGSETSSLLPGSNPTELLYSGEGTLKVYDLATETLVGRVGDAPKPGEVPAQVFSRRARNVNRVAILRRSKDLSVWDLSTRTLVRRLSDSNDFAWPFSISPNGRFVAAFHGDVHLGMELFDVDRSPHPRRIVPAKEYDDEDITSTFTSDGGLLLARHNHVDGFATILRSDDATPVRTLSDGKGMIYSDEFWHDDGHLLSTLPFGDILIRDADGAGEVRYTLRDLGVALTTSGQRFLVTGVGGKRLITVSDLQWPVRHRAQREAAHDAIARTGTGRATPEDFSAAGRWFALHAEDEWAIDCLTEARARGAADASDALELAVCHGRLGDQAAAAEEYDNALRASGNSYARAAYLRLCRDAHRQAALARWAPPAR